MEKQIFRETGIRNEAETKRTAQALADRVRQKPGDQIVSSFIVSNEFMENLKFSEQSLKQIDQELLANDS